jgi:hypothetical protein
MGNYVTVDDVRAEGVSEGDFPDPLVNRRIVKWEGIAERLTRNIFRVVEPGELVFNGNNLARLHFNTALVEVTEVKINGSDTALDAADFRAYTGRQRPQDDRGNPKIELTGAAGIPSGQSTPSPWAGGSSASLFMKGLEQKITAKWGYVDDDPDNPGSFICPPPVKESILALVIRDLKGYFEQYYEGASKPSGAPVNRERTDDHELQWAAMTTVITWGMLPNDIRDTLLMYRGPMAIEVPEVRNLTAFDVNFIGAW